MKLQEKQKTGFQSPFGANLYENGVLFSFASRSATGARLLLYDRVEDWEPSRVIHFDETRDRLGDVWRLFVPNLAAGSLYHFQVDGPFNPSQGNRFDGRARLVDPYAKALAGDFLPKRNGVCHPPKCVVIDDDFNWDGDLRIRRNFADETIYELHVRGFTNSPTSSVSKPGTYLGLVEKIPYLKSLGVTAVELMPIHEFPRNAQDGANPAHANYWGYDPIAFFAPHRGYAWSQEPGAQVREFKEMVRELHRAGIEVYLDVVFNHTAEGNEQGETFAFKGLENSNYYLLGKGGRYVNFSGCGNTINGNHPWMRNLIFDCLRSWVGNYHIDGFRFDLASILSRDRNGNLVWNPPTLEAISEDPFLADAKFIAEAWDAAGAYQVGSFGTRRWAEWNGRYRDDVRRFWRGDEWTTNAFATRLSGSSDLYAHQGRTPSCSVNFVTAHDGFTLNDLVTYNQKHNFDNGEENRDGENNNNSFNFGIEGETDDPEVNRLRDRQVRNFFGTLLFSQGVPMIVAGDETRHTQKGNNNAYCQDSPLSWIDWNLVEKNENLKRFVAALIHFRRQEATLRRRNFLTGKPQVQGGTPDVSWFDRNGGAVNWRTTKESTLTCLIGALDPLKDPGFAKEIAKTHAFVSERFPFDVLIETAPEARYDILLLFNATNKSQKFQFPELAKGKNFKWRIFVNTAAEAPYDVYPECDGPEPETATPFDIAERSMRVYISSRDWNNM